MILLNQNRQILCMHTFYFLVFLKLADNNDNIEVNRESNGILLNKKSLSDREAFEVVLSGLEPPTHGFSVRCSTN